MINQEEKNQMKSIMFDFIHKTFGDYISDRHGLITDVNEKFENFFEGDFNNLIKSINKSYVDKINNHLN